MALTRRRRRESARLNVADGVNPPSIANFPSAVAIVVVVVFTGLLLFVAGKFDPTKGVLTISLMIVLGMLGATAYCLVFTIPNDDITPGVVGALSAGFGAVVAYWLGRATQGSPRE
jgi:hypothetical protein